MTDVRDSSPELAKQVESAWQELSQRVGLPQFMSQVTETLNTFETRMKALEELVPSAKVADRIDPQTVQLNDYAVQLYHMNQLDQAEQILQEAVSQFPQNASMWNNLAVVQSGMGKMDDARASFQEATKLDATSVEVLNTQGVLALLENDPEKAIPIFEAAQRSDPQRVEVLLNLAWAFESLEKLESALKLWKIVLLLDPQNMDAQQKLKAYYSYE